MGTEDEQVDEALEIIKGIRKDPKHEQSRITVFVLEMEHYEQL
jgi:hypothetical protein